MPIGNLFFLQLYLSRVKDEHGFTSSCVTGTLEDEELVLVERSKGDAATGRTLVLG